MRNLFGPRRSPLTPARGAYIKSDKCFTCGAEQDMIPAAEVTVRIGNHEYSITWTCTKCGEKIGRTFYSLDSPTARAAFADLANAHIRTVIVDAELGDPARGHGAFDFKRAVRADLAVLPVVAGAVSGEWARVVADNM